MEGAQSQNAPSSLGADKSRVDRAVSALYPGGDFPHPEEEAERMQKESAFSSTKREHIAFSCLSFAHAYMHENRQLYQELAKEKSPQHGMREDDVLVAMLHQMWAGCYNNALSLPEPASVSALSFQEAGDLLKAHDITERFSMQTLQLLDQSIRRFAEADFPDVSGHATPSSIVTAVAAACLVVVLELTMFILRHLSKRYYKASQEDRRALHSTESETLSQTSPQEGYPSEEKSKVAEMQERMSCIPRSGSSRRASIAELPKGPSRGAPQRSS
ncbi:hypothetical protein, conserved [Eimeria brunetti]|uniref:Transmembrane protein n=1 Tax=Eimeria brunetti TaxID=51314 RepID=U6L8G4_9EIME|nr:hypothetical protein, conserved [Eimeria brunetti]